MLQPVRLLRTKWHKTESKNAHQSYWSECQSTGDTELTILVTNAESKDRYSYQSLKESPNARN